MAQAEQVTSARKLNPSRKKDIASWGSDAVCQLQDQLVMIINSFAACGITDDELDADNHFADEPVLILTCNSIIFEMHNIITCICIMSSYADIDEKQINLVNIYCLVYNIPGVAAVHIQLDFPLHVSAVDFLLLLGSFFSAVAFFFYWGLLLWTLQLRLFFLVIKSLLC